MISGIGSHENGITQRRARGQALFEGVQHCGGGGITIGGCSFEGRSDHFEDILGHPGSSVFQRRNRFVADGHEQSADGRAAVDVRRRTGQRAIHDAAERPNIAARIDIFGRQDLFGRHVQGGTEQRAGCRHTRRLRGFGRIALDFGNSEIEQFDEARAVGLSGQKEVGRLDVAMNDARGVCGDEALERLGGDTQRGVRRERSDAINQLLQILTLEKLHHDVRVTGGFIEAGVEHLHDVFVLDRPGGA